MFKVLFQDGSQKVSAMNVGNNAVLMVETEKGIATEFIARMNIDCECNPPKLKVTGITESDSQSYTFCDENVMVGEFTKAIMNKQKENGIQEVE